MRRARDAKSGHERNVLRAWQEAMCQATCQATRQAKRQAIHPAMRLPAKTPATRNHPGRTLLSWSTEDIAATHAADAPCRLCPRNGTCRTTKTRRRRRRLMEMEMEMRRPLAARLLRRRVMKGRRARDQTASDGVGMRQKCSIAWFCEQDIISWFSFFTGTCTGTVREYFIS